MNMRETIMVELMGIHSTEPWKPSLDDSHTCTKYTENVKTEPCSYYQIYKLTT